ncbi:hypothetical protein Sango_0806300 [Sesamum angolense]|uniref:Uncharacterized protein n=1 Tax=Sesamum angolense TaxID=2727404 RepID=A0AAE1X2Z2_9LAMI|nr:hypothetical protein Sango_0806300 [Sesamum angolense]
MLKKLKESSQMSPLADYSFTTNVAPVMVTNATTIEQQLASLTRAIEGLTKRVQEQDAQIAQLINKADNVDANHIMGKQVEAHDEVEAPANQHYTEKDKYAKELQISSDGLIPVDQLKEFIKGTIRSKIEGSSKSSLTYAQPYTPRIDSLKMPMGYQPQKFQQFDEFIKMARCFDVLTTDIERGFNITTKYPRIGRLTRGVGLRISLAAMKPTPKGRSRTFQVEDRDWASRTSRLGIEDPMETCTKYCNRFSSAGDVGRLCSFSGLVDKSRAYEDCILDMASSGCVVRHGHHKSYPVQSEYVARTVDSKRGSIPCHYMTESSPMHLEMV